MYLSMYAVAFLQQTHHPYVVMRVRKTLALFLSWNCAEDEILYSCIVADFVLSSCGSFYFFIQALKKACDNTEAGVHGKTRFIFG